MSLKIHLHRDYGPNLRAYPRPQRWRADEEARGCMVRINPAYIDQYQFANGEIFVFLGMIVDHQRNTYITDGRYQYEVPYNYLDFIYDQDKPPYRGAPTVAGAEIAGFKYQGQLTLSHTFDELKSQKKKAWRKPKNNPSWR